MVRIFSEGGLSIHKGQTKYTVFAAKFLASALVN